jgi:methylmalonyl-CoA/ethylmalonyl-CoA epimerase
MKVHHLAIAVSNIDEYRKLWSDLLDMNEPEVHVLPDRGVKACIFETDNLRIELVESLGEDSPIAKFVKERGGGMHHIGLETSNIDKDIERVKSHGFKLIGETLLTGLGDTRVIFVHPKSLKVLVELVEPPK